MVSILVRWVGSSWSLTDWRVQANRDLCSSGAAAGRGPVCSRRV